MQTDKGTLFAKSGLIISCNKKFNFRDIKTYLSLIIRLGTRSRWSHTARTIVLHNIVFVIDSDFGLGRNGIAITPWEEWRKNKNEVHVYDPRQFSLASVAASELIRKQDIKAMLQCGVAKYDLRSFRFQMKKAITGEWQGDTEEGIASSQFYCSEFIAWICNVENWYKLTPDNLVTKRQNYFPQYQDLYVGPAANLEFK